MEFAARYSRAAKRPRAGLLAPVGNRRRAFVSKRPFQKEFAIPPRADALGSLIAPAAAAFVAARFYTFDPYYAPTLRRMSADGLVAGSWVYTLVGLALLAAILTRVRPLTGLILTALVLLMSAVTALAEGGGR